MLIDKRGRTAQPDKLTKCSTQKKKKKKERFCKVLSNWQRTKTMKAHMITLLESLPSANDLTNMIPRDIQPAYMHTN
ncbi:hypothetical protein Hanom_Chr02g00152071 [Helianthus anomalus]